MGLAFLFPGQGSQTAGMGAGALDAGDVLRKMWDRERPRLPTMTPTA